MTKTPSTPSKTSSPKKLKSRALTSIALPSAPAKKKASTVPEMELEGDKVQRYLDAMSQVEAATATIKELRPDVLEAGVRYVFEKNCLNGANSTKLISSVKISDKAPEDADEESEEEDDDDAAYALMVTVKKSSPALDPNLVNAALLRMKTVEGKPAVVDNYVQEVVQGQFDTTIFNDDKGAFSMDRFNKVMQALAGVAQELEAENPLSCHKVLVPKVDWPVRRWIDFSVEQNLQLHAGVIPAEVSIKAVAPVVGD